MPGRTDDHRWSQRHLSHYVEGDLRRRRGPHPCTRPPRSPGSARPRSSVGCSRHGCASEPPSAARPWSPPADEQGSQAIGRAPRAVPKRAGTPLARVAGLERDHDLDARHIGEVAQSERQPADRCRHGPGPSNGGRRHPAPIIIPGTPIAAMIANGSAGSISRALDRIAGSRQAVPVPRGWGRGCPCQDSPPWGWACSRLWDP